MKTIYLGQMEIKKWDSSQRRVVNDLTKPMIEFVLDIADVHDSELASMVEARKQMTETRDKLDEVIREREKKYHSDVFDAVTKEFEEFEDLTGNKNDMGAFILRVSKERKYKTDNEDI